MEEDIRKQGVLYLQQQRFGKVPTCSPVHLCHWSPVSPLVLFILCCGHCPALTCCLSLCSRLFTCPNIQTAHFTKSRRRMLAHLPSCGHLLLLMRVGVLCNVYSPACLYRSGSGCGASCTEKAPAPSPGWSSTSAKMEATPRRMTKPCASSRSTRRCSRLYWTLLCSFFYCAVPADAPLLFVFFCWTLLSLCRCFLSAQHHSRLLP